MHGCSWLREGMQLSFRPPSMRLCFEMFAKAIREYAVHMNVYSCVCVFDAQLCRCNINPCEQGLIKPFRCNLCRLKKGSIISMRFWTGSGSAIIGSIRRDLTKKATETYCTYKYDKKVNVVLLALSDEPTTS